MPITPEEEVLLNKGTLTPDEELLLSKPPSGKMGRYISALGRTGKEAIAGFEERGAELFNSKDVSGLGPLNTLAGAGLGILDYLAGIPKTALEQMDYALAQSFGGKTPFSGREPAPPEKNILQAIVPTEALANFLQNPSPESAAPATIETIINILGGKGIAHGFLPKPTSIPVEGVVGDIVGEQNMIPPTQYPPYAPFDPNLTAKIVAQIESRQNLPAPTNVRPGVSALVKEQPPIVINELSKLKEAVGDRFRRDMMAEGKRIENLTPQELAMLKGISLPMARGKVGNLAQSIKNADPISLPTNPSEEIKAEINPETQLDPTIQNPAKIDYFEKFKTKTNTIWTATKELVADNQERVRKLLTDPDIVNPAEVNRYEREILYHGRLGSRIERGYIQAQNIAADMVGTAKSLGMETRSLRDLTNRYLQAKHAPERNAVLQQERGAGISTEEARAAIDEIAGHPTIGPQVERIANQIMQLHNQTLEILREGGVIDQATVDRLHKIYPNHIPLQRILPEDIGVEDALSGKRFDVRGTGIKRAKGSELAVNDILGNVVHNYEQAIIRAERNLVDKSFLDMYRQNRDLFGDFVEERRPQIIGSTGERPIYKPQTDPRVLSLRENGRPVELFIQDSKLAAALKGINPQKLPALGRAVATITRWYSSLATRFNPEFALPNKIRDLQEMAVYLASQKELGPGEIGKTILKDPKSAWDVLDWVRGKDTPGAKLYEQMKLDGGTTGGLSLSTRQRVGIDIDNIFKRLESNPRQFAHQFEKVVDNWNTIFEDGTRLSVYREALAKGLSRERAALLAKQATINFNKFGTGGPIINALYMFSNASIQGSVKMLRAMRNPKVATAVVGTIGASVVAVNEWNDNIDSDWRNKVSKTDRFNGLTLVLPSQTGFKYIIIPVSWGIKPIKVAMDYASDAISGHTRGAIDAASGITGALVEAYNPVGGTDFVSAIIPSALDLPVDLARNKSWTGNPIRPDWDAYAPASIRYFQSLNRSQIGRVAIATTKKLAENGIEISPADVTYAYTQLVGGAGQAASKMVNTVSSMGRGEVPLPRDIPFTSRFYRSKTVEEAMARSAYREMERKMRMEKSRRNFYKRETKQEAAGVVP